MCSFFRKQYRQGRVAVSDLPNHLLFWGYDFSNPDSDCDMVFFDHQHVWHHRVEDGDTYYCVDHSLYKKYNELFIFYDGNLPGSLPGKPVAFLDSIYKFTFG